MKRYLGDSVYVEYDGWNIVLTTENGLGPSNTIYMEPNVLDALQEFREAIIQEKRINEQETGNTV